jgi:hypothetical protein
MTDYRNVIAEHDLNNALADKVNKLKNKLVKHIGKLEDKDKIRFNLQKEYVAQTLFLMCTKKAEIKNIKEQQQSSRKSNYKSYQKSAAVAFILYLYLYFTDASSSVQASYVLFVIGAFGFYEVRNLIFNHYALITNKLNADAYELLGRDLIANGLTMRDAYDYDVKKAHMEDLEPGKFLEMAVLEFEFECFERELKVLSANYNFEREDDFYVD